LFYPVNRLQMSTMGNLSSLAMTCSPPQEKLAQNGGFSGCGAQHNKMAPIFIAVGDNQGYISLWDTSAILAGYSSETAHRIVQIGEVGNLISALTLEPSTLISADWAGAIVELWLKHTSRKVPGALTISFYVNNFACTIILI